MLKVYPSLQYIQVFFLFLSGLTINPCNIPIVKHFQFGNKACVFVFFCIVLMADAIYKLANGERTLLWSLSVKS